MLRLLAAALAAWIVSSPAQARVHVVARGESLGEIAERYGARVADLRAWNDLHGDAIQIGQELTVDAPASAPEEARVVHRVRAGETLGRIAARLGVTVARVVSLNPGLDPDRLRAGSEIVIAGGAESESVGTPAAGSIEGAARLRPHPAYVLRSPERAYATQRTVDRLRAGFDAIHEAEPDAPRVRVHDLSLPLGGPIDDHRTHQSGRDVDITYYQRACGSGGCPLRTLTPAELDVRREWRLLHYWIARDEIEVIYVDYALQEPLYREAQRRGASAEELSRWFQYPRPASSETGFVRHYPNHANHVHVRFACHASEPRCEPSPSMP